MSPLNLIDTEDEEGDHRTVEAAASDRGGGAKPKAAQRTSYRLRDKIPTESTEQTKELHSDASPRSSRTNCGGPSTNK